MRRGSNAIKVAAGILLSRLVGFLRDRAVAHYFGVGPFADVFRTALRGPNVLQNLLGEGSISAAFIPIYARMLDEGREREAGRFAGAIFGLLLAAAAILSLIGVALAPAIVAVLTPGLLADAERVAAGSAAVDRYPLAVTALRIIFPMTGLLVLSAWALGVLNSHRRFFLPYFAPVLWNAAIIAGLLSVGSGRVFAETPTPERLLLAACFGALAGGLLQLAVQLPSTLGLLTGFRVGLSLKVAGVREALRAFGPVVLGRGVYQLSAYLDLVLASVLATGAIGVLGWAQTLYVLPISLFGMSVAAAELPEMARQRGADQRGEFARRLAGSLRQMAFLTVPTAVGYLVFGFLLVGALYRTGSFGVADNWLVYLVLCGYSLGLLATTWSRLLQNAFYALSDTATPARVALRRVIVSTLAALPAMFVLDRVALGQIVGEDGRGSGLYLGAAGLALGSALGAWVELWTLVRRLRVAVEGFRLPIGRACVMTALALGAAVAGAGLWWVLPVLHVAWTALAAVGGYALAYLAGARLLGLDEARAWLGRR